MNQKDKELLLKDLSARLPYGVIVDYKENEFEIPHWKITTIYPETMDGWIGYDKRVGVGSVSGSRCFNIGEVKPYLRPMSSMTDEERYELQGILGKDVEILDDFMNIIDSSRRTFSFLELLAVFDWLNANHFDYRGLIPMGLAFEAMKGMYK